MQKIPADIYRQMQAKKKGSSMSLLTKCIIFRIQLNKVRNKKRKERGKNWTSETIWASTTPSIHWKQQCVSSATRYDFFFYCLPVNWSVRKNHLPLRWFLTSIVTFFFSYFKITCWASRMHYINGKVSQKHPLKVCFI